MTADEGRFRWKKCALDRIRTYDLLLRRQTLYPLSYEGAATGVNQWPKGTHEA